MNIGIISDIHGDVDSLITVLNRFETYHHTDYIVCAGDLIGRGPQENRVVDIIREREIPTVRGNHDEWFYNLSKPNTAFLKGLPVDLELSYDGVNVFMCHGKPGNNMWGLYRDHISDTLLNMMLGTLKADVLITGHTHVPMYIQVEQGVVINPGSLYNFKSSRYTSHTYGVLSLPRKQFELYDITMQVVEPIGVEQYE